MQRQDTHSKVIGYLLWIFGFLGAHRFYYGRPVTGTIWFFTLGLFFIGWIIDLFLIPSMMFEELSVNQYFLFFMAFSLASLARSPEPTGPQGR